MSTTQSETPWAVLLCNFSDNLVEPFPRRYYENLFTNAGVGLHNMVDFFRDYTHGNIDIGGSRVFGWFTLPETLSDANQKPREHILELGKQTAANQGVNLNLFWGVLVCTNVPYQTFGFQGGQAAVADSFGMFPGILGQEMGHGYNLDHSRINGSTAPYKDPWDIMSGAVITYRASDPQFSQIGPGLNAANMDGRGWLDPDRVWSQPGFFNQTLELRPHYRRDLDGFLVARVGRFYVEFRSVEGWDAGIPRPAVLVHRLDGNISYLMPGTNGTPDLQPGDVFQDVDQQLMSRVEVMSIDTNTPVATVKLSILSTKNLLVASVTPYPLPVNRAVSTKFTTKDATTGNSVAGKVKEGGAVIGDTNTTFSHNFKTTKKRIGGQWEVIYPVVTVSVPAYADMDVDCGFP